jgi:hypothetical protein
LPVSDAPSSDAEESKEENYGTDRDEIDKSEHGIEKIHDIGQTISTTFANRYDVRESSTLCID